MRETIDWEQLEAVADGFCPDFLEIYEELLTEAGTLFEKLRGSLEAGNLRDVARLAHQLKGALANFGFAEAARFLRETELAVSASKLPPEILQLITEAEASYRAGVEEIRAHLQSLKESHPDPA